MTDEEVNFIADQLQLLLSERSINNRHKIEFLRRNLAHEFGERLGYKLSDAFTLMQLKEMWAGAVNDSCDYSFPHKLFDHVWYYRWSRKPSRPIAMAVHLYNDLDKEDQDLINFCEKYGLAAHHIDDFPSWYWPRTTNLILYTSRKSAELEKA